MRRGKPVAVATLYVDDAPSAMHDYLFRFDDAKDDASPASVWRRDVLVDEERSPLVAAVVCAARLVGAEPMLAHDSDSDDEEAERDLDASCSFAQCATLLGVALARVYPPTPASVARAISGGNPVLVVHDGAPCVLHTVDESGDIGAERFVTCVGTAARFTPRDVRYMFGFWAPVAPEAESAASECAESETETE